MKTLVLSVFFALTAPLAMGQTAAIPVSQSCSKVASDTAYQAFADYAGISVDDVDNMAIVDQPYVEQGDSANQLTVNFNTRNSYDWDGYATYRITVEENGDQCNAVKTELMGSSGL